MELYMPFFMVSFILFVLKYPVLVLSKPRVPCYFIFGDSLVDNGNNNGLKTLAKANYPPYGIDFPGEPTGRFSNGRNLADFIAKDLGFDGYIPPFAISKGKDIVRGVNYASGGAGIRDETGRHMGEVISLRRQLVNHKAVIRRITALRKNKKKTKKYMTKCLYTVGMGSNDYINNYFAPKFYNSSRLFTPDQYAEALTDQYSQQLKLLYKLGARKIAVFSLVQIGCTPAEMAIFGATGLLCVNKINDAVNLFNIKLKAVIDELNSILEDANFILVDGNAPMTLISDTVKLITPCCNVSRTGAVGLCLPKQAPCSSRLEYVFFDGFHPTESANLLVAKLVFPHLLKLISN